MMLPKRFLTLRDKNGSHRRSKSAEPGQKSRNSAEVFLSIFKSDAAKQAAREEQEREKEAAKIGDVEKILEERGLPTVSYEDIRHALGSLYSDGNIERAADFIEIQAASARGDVFPYDPHTEMVGAVNRGNVTCWLDALLFSMFARLEPFECMLKTQFPETDKRARLVVLMRLWVNMLRTGKLINTDVTKLLQESLAACGWSDAAMLEQQDASEAFGFITETLQLPLLSLQVDLFHHGEKDKDDHKVVQERLLNISIPPDPEGKGIKLEDCLEEFFNARVDVSRPSQVPKEKGQEPQRRDTRPSLGSRSTIRVVTEVDENAAGSQLAMSPLPITPVEQEDEGAPADSQQPEAAPSSPTRPEVRHRSTSVIQRVVLDEEGRPSASGSGSPTLLQKAMRTGSTVVKAVTIPAWQFFRFIPWHAATTSEPQNDVEVAMNFEQRPVVGICLKRYLMTEFGQPRRHNTFVDIPDSLRLPHFMIAEDRNIEGNMGLSTEYKLVLQSIVCHRGDSTQSGHYIALARVAPKLLTDNRRHDHDPPPDYEEAQWVIFDDLQLDNRVRYVDDIRQTLKDEMPYLLFYQVVPMVEVSSPSNGEISVGCAPHGLPSYADLTSSKELAVTPSIGQQSFTGSSRASLDYFESASIEPSPRPPSIRLSSEMDRSGWPANGSGELTNGSRNESHRGSVNLGDSLGDLSAAEPPSPAVTPIDETTAQRLSRAAARLTSRNKSRPVSQVGDGRMSLSKGRLGLSLIKTSRDPLVESNGLNITNATASSPTKDGAEPPGDGEAEGPRGHKRLKSKEKQRAKTSPPERECAVM